ncbi:DMT family transporter [Actinophytocola sp.]|uniref:DMT family transporter n=1 Tax=Actinophytocola sp. TaxID=1872138 RepID=UPI00389997F1
MRHSVLAAVGLVVMWSSGFVGARLGTAHAAADTLLAWRYLVVAVLVGAVAVVRRPRLAGTEVRRQAVLGLLCQALYLAGVVTGVGMGVPAGVAALIAVLQPLVVGALAGPVLGQRVRPRQWAGLVAGFAGVAVVVAGDLGGGGHVLGYLLVVGGMLALSVGTLLERRWRLGTRPFDQLTIHCLVSCGVFVAAAAVTGRLAPPAAPGFWWAVLWVVVLSTFGGYGCYLLALRAFGATGASTLLFLTPPTTMVWALLMFGEPVGWTTAAGLAGCAAAVWLVLTRPGTRPSRPGRSTTHAESPARV